MPSEYVTINIKDLDISQLYIKDNVVMYGDKVPIITLYDPDSPYMMNSYQGIKHRYFPYISASIDSDTSGGHGKVIKDILDTISTHLGLGTPYTVSKRGGYTYLSFRLSNTTPFYHVRDGKIPYARMHDRRIRILPDVVPTIYTRKDGHKYLSLRARCIYFKDLAEVPDKALMDRLS